MLHSPRVTAAFFRSHQPGGAFSANSIANQENTIGSISFPSIRSANLGLLAAASRTICENKGMESPFKRPLNLNQSG